MYYLSQKELFFVILYAFFIGMLLGILWDLFRILRMARAMGKRKKLQRVAGCLQKLWQNSSDILTAFEDILFFTLAAVLVCIFLYHANSGKLRGIVVFSSFTGFLFYYFTLGRLVFRLSERIINVLSFLVKTVFKFTFLPVFCLIKKIFLIIYVFMRKKHLTKRTKSYIKKMYGYAENGFGI
ncbi:MAG: hypothetical protein E7623_01920 [Ruminococcaceae bacterium]|nr:hypothetical protein [Oscillospiraceae bacterium]